MSNKIISPMELITLLSKSKQTVKNLSLAEHGVMVYLLSCANLKDGEGYKCWPSTDAISEATGIHSKTVEKVRKTLVDAGWMQYKSGKGKGNCNTYYVNGFKIVEIYIKSGNPKPDKEIATSPKLGNTKPVQRNTSGLNNSKQASKPVPVAEPVKAPEKPTEARPGPNPDGSPPFWPNGERRYSYNDTMPPSNIVKSNNQNETFYDDSLECPF